MLVLYTYAGCDSCRKAIKWLESRGHLFENRPIRETPPSLDELRLMLGYYGGEFRKLFNVSGQDYRRMNLKELLPGMSEGAAIELLGGNGNLIKRPFALGEGWGRVGFKESEWEVLLAD